MKSQTFLKADLTVIMIGTNDIRLGMTATAIRNVTKIEELMKTRNVIMAHIPPMEIGNQGSEHCEETKIDRGIYNRTITDKFRHYAKMTDLVKENINGSILTKDGYHLTQKGGEWAAAQLERAIKRLTDKNEQGTNQGNPPTPPPSTTPTDTDTTSNQPKTTPNKQPEMTSSRPKSWSSPQESGSM